MNHEDRNEKSKAYTKFRGSMHMGMGVLYVIFGALVLYIKYFGAMELSSGVAYTIGTLMVLYGLFRLWRGYAYMRQRHDRG